jgi:hypothetical protein
MYQKQKELVKKQENDANPYAIEIATVNTFLVERQRKDAGGKNEGKSHYVVENTCRKNVRFPACQDLVENKLVRASLPRSI